MKATRLLPDHYHAIGILDIAKDRKLVIWLNGIGLALLFISGWFFFQVIAWLRPVLVQQQANVQFTLNIVDLLKIMLGVIALSLGNAVIHEAIHGLCFTWFTHQRPVFAFHWTYAYAAAPDWFMPRNAYLITALSPLLCISAAAILLFAFVPQSLLLSIWFVATVNAGGAVGDLWVAGWLLRTGADCLARDEGSRVTLYRPVEHPDILSPVLQK